MPSTGASAPSSRRTSPALVVTNAGPGASASFTMGLAVAVTVAAAELVAVEVALAAGLPPSGVPHPDAANASPTKIFQDTTRISLGSHGRRTGATGRQLWVR